MADDAAVLAHLDARRGVGGVLETSSACLRAWPTTRSIVLLTPNGLSQRMQWNGSSSLSTRALAVAARKSSCGVSVITFSGQVALHSPHCTQASSAKRSIGRSGLSLSAPVGQADTQARQSVQPSTLISTAPNGAPCGQRDDIDRGRRGALQLAQREPHARRACRPTGRKLAGCGAAAGRSDRAQRVAERDPDRRSRWSAARPAPKPRPARIGSASASVRVRPAMSWRGLARSSKRTAAAP